MKYDLGFLIVEPRSGEWVFNACKRLVKVACMSNQMAVMSFNDYAIYAGPDSNALQLARQYCLDRC